MYTLLVIFRFTPSANVLHQILNYRQPLEFMCVSCYYAELCGVTHCLLLTLAAGYVRLGTMRQSMQGVLPRNMLDS